MEMKVIVLLLRALSAKVGIKTFYVDCCDMCVSLCVCVCFYLFSQESEDHVGVPVFPQQHNYLDEVRNE